MQNNSRKKLTADDPESWALLYRALESSCRAADNHFSESARLSRAPAISAPTPEEVKADAAKRLKRALEEEAGEK